MTIFEKILIIFIIILFTSLSHAVIKTAYEIGQKIEERTEQRSRLHLPSKCRQHYNDGTNRWKECMGVGYK